MGFPCGAAGKESACNADSIPGLGKTSWRRKRLPTPVFWPGEFHGLYSPWGHKELDTTEQISPHSSSHINQNKESWVGEKYEGRFSALCWLSICDSHKKRRSWWLRGSRRIDRREVIWIQGAVWDQKGRVSREPRMGKNCYCPLLQRRRRKEGGEEVERAGSSTMARLTEGRRGKVVMGVVQRRCPLLPSGTHTLTRIPFLSVCPI